MASSLLPPPPPPPSLSLSLSSTSTSIKNNLPILSISRKRLARQGTRIIPNATERDENDKPAFNPFGFVTDNPSSRSAIQLPESPAEDGNVGQMLYRIEDKGKEYGSYIKSGKFVWFVRETGSPDSPRGTIVFLHGAPTQSYSYRVVMSQMSDSGYHCIAPDWIGFGFSDKPQPGYGFNYTEKEFHEEFDRLLNTLEIKSPFFLVVQVFVDALITNTITSASSLCLSHLGSSQTCIWAILTVLHMPNACFQILPKGVSCRLLWIDLGSEKYEQDIETRSFEQSVDSFISHSWAISAAKVR